MKPFLLYSDLHIRPERIEDCKRVLQYIGAMALKIQDKLKAEITIINGGDTFNTRGLIHTKCFDVLYKEYKAWFDSGLKQWIIVGNHDQEDRAGKVHPMSVFQSWTGWHTIDRPTLIDNIAMFPYMDDREEAKRYINKFIKEGAQDAVVHWGIKGAMRNDWNKDTDGIPVEWLKPFRKVFSGHYHYRNSIENVQYIGSPFQQNFAEREQTKGVIYYEQESNKERFYEIKGTPKHYEIEIHQEGDEIRKSKANGSHDWEEIGEKDFIKVKISGDSEFCKTFKKEEHLGTIASASVKIERAVKERHHSRLNIKTEEILSPLSLMEKYVDFIDTPLNKKQLLDVGKELISGL